MSFASRIIILTLRVGVGNDGDFRRFASRPGRRGNCDERRTGIRNAVISLKLADRTGIGSRNADHLRHIESAASADRENRIAFSLR